MPAQHNIEVRREKEEEDRLFVGKIGLPVELWNRANFLKGTEIIGTALRIMGGADGKVGVERAGNHMVLYYETLDGTCARLIETDLLFSIENILGVAWAGNEAYDRLDSSSQWEGSFLLPLPDLVAA